MISRLRLINFRRHIDTEIDFSDDAQIVAITGSNGAGKSTILEALVYALYGESRHGRRSLARMVRRDAIHEGLTVEMGFSVAGVQYDITRRYEKGKSSAILMAGGSVIMQSPDGVTAEVSRILGMDAVGFRLAVIAQQFDVDGLADLTPARRKVTITRLLRQDSLTTASKRARELYNTQLEIIRALGSGPDLDLVETELAQARESANAADDAVADARTAIAALDAELVLSSDVESQWHQAQVALATATATANAAQSEIGRLEAELAQVRVPPQLPAPARDLDAVNADLHELTIEIARAEAAQERAADAAAAAEDLAAATTRQSALVKDLDGQTPASTALALVQQDGAIVKARTALQEAQNAATASREELAQVTFQLTELARRTQQAAQLGDVCDTCEQDIPDEHRHRQEEKRATLQANLDAAQHAAQERVQETTKAQSVATEALSAAQTTRETLMRRQAAVDAMTRELNDVQRRRAQYEAKVARLTVEEVDLDGLFAAKGLLAVEQANCQHYAQVTAAREGALARRDHVQALLAGAQERYETASAEQQSATPPDSLAAAYAARRETLTRRADEAELLSCLESERAAAAERVVSAQKVLTQATGHQDKLREHRNLADTAAKSAAVLTRTAEKMATLIRPQLEGEISVLLQQLSEGRFTRVNVSDDYEITVEDDGAFQPVSEFSGGEGVLIALATRLALANIVAGRQGSGAAGFLILDEVFGSQDVGRRQAILAGLRTLRATYGQILLISHVGGLEEAADRIVEVRGDVVEGQRIAEVTAA